MSPKFSDRQKITQPLAIQLNSMNEALRNSIWNFLLENLVLGDAHYIQDTALQAIAGDFFKVPVDKVPQRYQMEFQEWLHRHYFVLPWHEVYNFLEFVIERGSWLANKKYNYVRQLIDAANAILTREMSAYRFIDGILSPISSEVEIASISQATTAASETGLEGVRVHLHAAMELLGKRPQPDYRNSIKESISAVESAVKCISGTNSGGLNGALKVLAKHTEIHPALKEGFSKLYGYTSNEDGIRHAILEESDVGFDEAKFMVVACSAFVNFLIAKASATGALPKATG